MSDDLDAVLREMWPGLRPSERILDGERQYSDRHRACADIGEHRRMDIDEAREAVLEVVAKAVPDKEQQMKRPEPPAPEPDYEKLPPGIHRDKENGTLYGVTRGSGDRVTVSTPPPESMPLSDALARLAADVDDVGHINADVHGLPIEFFARDDVEEIDTLISQGRVLITGRLVIGGHRFLCFSKGFPMGAE